MRTFLIIALAAAATGVIVGVVIAGSGDGGSKSDRVVTPELTVPSGGRTSTSEGATGATGTSGTSTGSGGASKPSGTGGSTTTPKQTTTRQQQPQEPSGGASPPSNDTKTHDVPPPKDSPAGRYEQFCKKHPDAC